MAVASLVLGVLGIVLSIIPGLFYLGIPLALIGLTLGVLARKRALAQKAPTGLATAGLVLDVVGLVLGLTVFGFFTFMVRKGVRMVNDPTLQKQYNREFDEAFKKATEEAKTPGNPER